MNTRGRCRHHRSVQSGFTVVELFIVLVVLAVCVALILPMFGRARTTQIAMKCSTQIRGIMQGMVIWAQSNGDRYPLPSIVDKANGTVALATGETPQSKDTSANIMSLLIFNGYIPAEMCVSPQEANANIKPYEGYMFSAPTTAAKPDAALWDPAFNADFTGTKPGGLSYAHQLPRESEDAATPFTESKSMRWGNSFSSLDAAIGNRGPQAKGVDVSKDPPVATLVNPNSRSLLIHGAPSTWEGNIGFNDNHVEFNNATTLFAGHYSDATGAKKPDCLFFDEPDAGLSGNNFLGIFIKGGTSRKDFVSIWD